MNTEALEVSLEEADRTFREALAYALFVTNPRIVSIVVQEREAGSDLETALEAFWGEAEKRPSHIAWPHRSEAIRRAGVVHEEMVKRLEKMP
jgi:hypothetical protein